MKNLLLRNLLIGILIILYSNTSTAIVSATQKIANNTQIHIKEVYTMNNQQIKNLIRDNRIEEALDICETIEDYSNVIDLMPNEADAYWLRSICYYEKEDYENSLKDIDKAISLGFVEAGVYSLRGSVNCGLEKYEEAINDFNMSIKLDPKYCEAYRKRAEVRGYLGDNKGAKEDCIKACELNPEYELDELLNNCIFSDSDVMISNTLNDLNSVDNTAPLIFQKAKAFWEKITGNSI